VNNDSEANDKSEETTMPDQATSAPAPSTMSDLHSESLFSEMIWLLSGVPLGFMLQSIAELGIADELVDGPLPVEELAKRTESDPEALYRILRAVATRGVFTEVAYRTFGITQLGHILRSDVPNSLRDAFRMHAQKSMRDAFAEVGHTIRTGEAAFEHAHGMGMFPYYMRHRELTGLFESFTGTAARRIQHAALETYDLTGIRKIVDIGEMSGRLLASLLTRFPDLRGAYVDVPFVMDGAKRALDEAGVGDRAELIPGGYAETVPPEGDVYLLPQLLHRLGDAEAIAVLKNIRQVIPPDGRVLVIDPVLPEGDLPHLAKVLDATMMLMGPIRDRTEAEFVEIFASAGLRLTGVFGRSLPSSVVVAVPA
jgi:SAM-dependent methyltransferase